ncbi:hypothetical protein [Pelagibius sp.]|uniref:hypothetical protein n=1 Tax=Pelagibius sp. TaxID=1931238 RepID=UPI003BAE2589
MSFVVSQFKRDAKENMIAVNLPTASVGYHLPFCGCNNTSCGPWELGRYAVEFHTTVRISCVAPLWRAPFAPLSPCASDPASCRVFFSL